MILLTNKVSLRKYTRFARYFLKNKSTLLGPVSEETALLRFAPRQELMSLKAVPAVFGLIPNSLPKILQLSITNIFERFCCASGDKLRTILVITDASKNSETNGENYYKIEQ